MGIRSPQISPDGTQAYFTGKSAANMWQICSIDMTNLWGQTCNSGNNVCPIPVRVLSGFTNGVQDGAAHVAGFSALTGIAVPPHGTTLCLVESDRQSY
jgi:hypothetical protein